MSTVIYTCQNPECRRTFGDSRRRVYCSKACAGRVLHLAGVKTVACLKCGKSATILRSCAKRYCSRDCVIADQRARVLQQIEAQQLRHLERRRPKPGEVRQLMREWAAEA